VASYRRDPCVERENVWPTLIGSQRLVNNLKEGQTIDPDPMVSSVENGSQSMHQTDSVSYIFEDRVLIKMDRFMAF
jgi:hypothetical protein